MHDGHSGSGLTLGDWLAQEPYTLGLSSGFFGFFAHAGFLAALEDAELPPAALSGSSAGALVAGVWASGRSMTTLRSQLFTLKREDFWDPGLGFGLLKGELFAERLHEFLGAKTFDACESPLSISTFDLQSLKTRVIKEGSLVTAIRGSCCFPGLFHPVKVDGRWSIDGGVLDRPGLAGIADGARLLYHHLDSRSRLRKHVGPLTGVPRRENMAVIRLQNLPRLGPNCLEMGADAYHQAYGRMSQALTMVVDPSGPGIEL